MIHASPKEVEHPGLLLLDLNKRKLRLGYHQPQYRGHGDERRNAESKPQPENPMIFGGKARAFCRGG
jgi:hypothetical protein